MAYQIHYIEESGVLETVFEGKLKTLEIIAALQKNYRLFQDHQVHLFLADCSQMMDEKDRVSDNYEIGSFMVKNFDKLPHNFREAVVLPENETSKANLRFFETVARNRGLKVRTFDTRDAALGWLLST